MGSWGQHVSVNSLSGQHFFIGYQWTREFNLVIGLENFLCPQYHSVSDVNQYVLEWLAVKHGENILLQHGFAQVSKIK